MDDEMKKRMAKAKAAGFTDEQIQQAVQAKTQAQPQPAASAGMGVDEAVQPAPKDGFIKSVAKSLVKPAFDYGKMVAGAGYEGVRAIQSAAGKQNVYVDAQGNAKANPFLSEEDLKKFSPSANGGVGKPIIEGAKRTAGAMSYFVPGGKGVGGAIKAGAATGGLYGFSQSKKDDVEGLAVDAATGAISGAAVGGAVAGAGKLLKGAKGAGEAARKGVAQPKVNADPFMAEEETKIMSTLKNHGLKGSAEAQKQQMPTVFRTISANIKKKLATSKGSISTADVTRVVDDALDNNVNFDTGIPMMQKAKDKYINQIVGTANKGKDGLTVSPGQLFELKQNLGKQLSNAFKKLDRGTPLTDKEEVAMTVWHSIDDMITKAEPAVKEMTKAQSYLYKAMPGLAKSAENKLTVPVIGTIPGNRPVQAIQDATGRALESVGGAVEKIPQVAGDMAIKGGSMLAADAAVGQPTDTGIPPEQATQSDQTPSEPTVAYESPDGQWFQSTDGKVYSKDKQWTWDNTANDWVPAQTTEAGAMPSKDDLMQSIANATDKKTQDFYVSKYNALYGANGMKISASAQKRLSAMNQAEGIYNMVEELAKNAGTGVPATLKAKIGTLPGVEGGSEEDLQRVNMALAKGIAGALANEVGVATDRDIERWMGLMPKVSDTMDERLRALARLKSSIASSKQQILANTDGSGMDVGSATAY